MLINVKDPARMPIKYLWQLVFTFTFDKKSCGYMTKDIIGQQLMKWNDFVQINKKRELEKFGLDPEMVAIPIGQKGSAIDEMEYQIQLMSSWVVREEKGEFTAKAELYHKHKIDFRLTEPVCAVFPEYCKVHRNSARGEAALKAAMEANPEDYINPNKKKKFYNLN